jgi:hypothetical protein
MWKKMANFIAQKITKSYFRHVVQVAKRYSNPIITPKMAAIIALKIMRGYSFQLASIASKK